MGLAFRAFTGFAIAFALLNPAAVEAWFQSPRIEAVRIEIAKEHPRQKLYDAVVTAVQGNTQR